MKNVLYDSELRILNLLWEKGDMTAKRLSALCLELYGWSKTTTYTVAAKAVAKGLIRRTEPHFVCCAACTREELRARELTRLIDRLYDGDVALLAEDLAARALNEKEIRA